MRCDGIDGGDIVHTHDTSIISRVRRHGSRRPGAALVLHPDDLPLWNDVEMQCRMVGVPVPVPQHGLWLKDEACWPSARWKSVAFTPGPTPGSSVFTFPLQNCWWRGRCFAVASAAPICGAGFDLIEQSIRERLYARCGHAKS